jgi:hypothetical protein
MDSHGWEQLMKEQEDRIAIAYSAVRIVAKTGVRQ